MFSRANAGKKIVNYWSGRSLLFAFLIALAATLSSLFYSNVLGFPSCELCWFQRIFLFPQVFILGLALWKGDAGAALYCMALSVAGAVIAIYQIFVQAGLAPSGSCPASQGVSCAIKSVEVFGYITIPVMSLTAFVLILLSLNIRRFKQKN